MLVGLRYCPILVFADVVIIAAVLIRNNLVKGLAAIVLLLLSLTFETAALGEFFFSQLVLDKPEAKFSQMIPVGDGEIRISPGHFGLVAKQAFGL